MAAQPGAAVEMRTLREGSVTLTPLFWAFRDDSIARSSVSVGGRAATAVDGTIATAAPASSTDESLVSEKAGTCVMRILNPRTALSIAVRSGDCETRRGCLSGALASLVVVVPRVTRRVTGRRLMRALGMICPRVRGGAGLASAAGLIRSLSARRA